jgi:antibiotic biosynthesis monooxygenase (ABM) superfamily enzyme
MTAASPGRQASRAASVKTARGPATLVLSRAVMPGHEHAFEAILHRLAAEARAFPGHQGLTVLRPQPHGPATYTIVAHFATRQDMDAWLSSGVRARLVAEADLHAAGGLRTRYLSGLEGWLAAPGSPVVLPPARWKIVVISLAGIAPLLEAVSYLLAPHLHGLPAWGRPLVSAAVLIPLMQYAVMPVLTRAARGFLYPGRRPAAPDSARAAGQRGGPRTRVLGGRA